MSRARARHGHVSVASMGPLAAGAAASVAIHAAALVVITLEHRAGTELARKQPLPAGEAVRVTLARPDAAPAVLAQAMPLQVDAAQPAAAKLELAITPRAAVRLHPTRGITGRTREVSVADGARWGARAPDSAPVSWTPAVVRAGAAFGSIRLPTETAPVLGAAPDPVGPGAERGAEIIDLIEPLYPERSVRNGDEGDVVVWVQVLADGSVGRVRVHESSGHALLDRAALRAAERCRFEAARRRGETIASEILVPFEFRIRG